MQKLGIGLTINQMIVDGPHILVELMDGQWKQGLSMLAPTITRETVETIGLSQPNIEVILRSMREHEQHQKTPSAVPPTPIEDNEDVQLFKALPEQARKDLLQLMRAYATSTQAPPAPSPPGGTLEFDPATGTRKWTPSADLLDTPEADIPEAAPAYLCEHCGRGWAGERSRDSHVIHCAKNPRSHNFRPDERDE